MTVPRLTVSDQPPLDSVVDVVILGALAADDTATLFSDPAFSELSSQLGRLGVTGARDQLVRLPASVGAACSLAIVGIGPEASIDALRDAAGSAVRQLTGVTSVAFAFPITTKAEAEAILEGAALGGYSFTSYRHSSLSSTKVPPTEIVVLTDLHLGDATTRIGVVADAVRLIKDLVNTPPSDLYPESLARLAVEAVEAQDQLPLSVRVWDEDELAADGFGGIVGVGQGSTRPPRLVKVSYAPAGATRHLALVGKGITFDTGGLSLKPPASMVGMKYDMTGAATVLAATVAAARLGLNLKVTAWLCIAENMPSGSAIRPNDVLRIRGGRTVEVLNTDAEGRLVLADGLVAASEESPDAIIDVATLTGAAIVALGTRYYATMGDDDLVDRVRGAAAEVGELAWPMPFPAELRPLLNSDVADIANAKIGSTAGGMLLAGVFLREFVGTHGNAPGAERIPWAHLDIAGPAHNTGSAFGFTGAGPTGISLRTILRLAEDFSRP